MRRLPLIALATKCREDARQFRVAAYIADQSAERLEHIICHGTDEEVSEALRLVDGCNQQAGEADQVREGFRPKTS